jgi:hypothetical protein
MKLRGILPPEMTWVRLILGPALMVGIIPVHILFAIHFPKRFLLCTCIATLTIVAIGLIVAILDPVDSMPVAP